MSVNLKPNERAPPVFFSQDHGMAHTGEGEGCDISEKTWEGGSHSSHSSNGPVRVSTQELSVSEANVCSVDMDEMSLIEDDWEAVVLLFTVPSKHSSFSTPFLFLSSQSITSL